MPAAPPLHVTVHYDFASSLCYVAHRVLARLEDFLAEVAIELEWTPFDLARVMHWRRGGAVEPTRLAHVAAVAEELAVPLRIPSAWIDSRPCAAAAMVFARRSAAIAATWRERVFTRIYEEGVPCDAPGELERLTRELGHRLDPAELSDAELDLEAATLRASEAQVTGVPTFMLGEWPFGGIQDEETLRLVLGRWATRRRERG